MCNYILVFHHICCIGLIGLGDAEVMGETVSALHAFDIPLVLASPRLAEMVTPKGNILTTAPDISSIVKVFNTHL